MRILSKYVMQDHHLLTISKPHQKIKLKVKKMARKPKITTELIKQAVELATAGFSDKQIFTALDLSSSTFYANMELMETIKKARNDLRKKVSDALMDSAVSGDTTAMIFLSKRLNLFQNSYTAGGLKSAKDALTELEKLYQAGVDGEIPIELINTISKILNDFVKTLEVSEL